VPWGHADAGILPDLRYSPFILDAAAFRTVVIDGAPAGRGMVGFAPALSVPDAEAIRGYLLRQAERQQRGRD
jgi:quinohemoprotein ethanol dehydrogenase